MVSSDQSKVEEFGIGFDFFLVDVYALSTTCEDRALIFLRLLISICSLLRSAYSGLELNSLEERKMWAFFYLGMLVL